MNFRLFLRSEKYQFIYDVILYAKSMFILFEYHVTIIDNNLFLKSLK